VKSVNWYQTCIKLVSNIFTHSIDKKFEFFLLEQSAKPKIPVLYHGRVYFAIRNGHVTRMIHWISTLSLSDNVKL